MAAPTASSAPNCAASPLDWVLFVITLLTLCLLWWVLEVPQLAWSLRATAKSPSADPTYGDRFRHFYEVIAWNCVRVLSPAYVLAVTLSRGTDGKKWLFLFYFGYVNDRDVPADGRLSTGQWLKIALLDGLVLVAQVPLAYRSAALARETQYPSPVLIGWWLFAALPGPLTGVFVFVASRLTHPPRRIMLLLIHLLVLALLGTAILLPIYFTSALYRSAGAAFAGGVAGSWAFIMFPLPLWRCGCGGPIHLLFYFMSAAVRMIPLLAEMLVTQREFVFCGANHLALQVVYAFFAGICVLQCGVAGGAICEGHRDRLGRLWKEKRREGDGEEGILMGDGNGNGDAREEGNGRGSDHMQSGGEDAGGRERS